MAFCCKNSSDEAMVRMMMMTKMMIIVNMNTINTNNSQIK